MIAVNIRSVVLASRAAITYLPDGGRIVSLGSCLAERVAIDYATVYSMSKSALLSFTRGLARELGPRHIDRSTWFIRTDGYRYESSRRYQCR